MGEQHHGRGLWMGDTPSWIHSHGHMQERAGFTTFQCFGYSQLLVNTRHEQTPNQSQRSRAIFGETHQILLWVLYRSDSNKTPYDPNDSPLPFPCKPHAQANPSPISCDPSTNTYTQLPVSQQRPQRRVRQTSLKKKEGPNGPGRKGRR